MAPFSPATERITVPWILLNVFDQSKGNLTHYNQTEHTTCSAIFCHTTNFMSNRHANVYTHVHHLERNETTTSVLKVKVACFLPIGVSHTDFKPIAELDIETDVKLLRSYSRPVICLRKCSVTQREHLQTNYWNCLFQRQLYVDFHAMKCNTLTAWGFYTRNVLQLYGL